MLKKFSLRYCLFLMLFSTIASNLLASYDATFNQTSVIYSAPASNFTDPKPQKTGNTCTVLEERDDWCKIVYGSDKIGWVKRSNVTPYYSQPVNTNISVKQEVQRISIAPGDKDAKYQEALALRKNGDYSGALVIFEALGSYKQADQYYRATLKELIISLQPGSVIRFGRFFGNDLEWFIVEKNNESALLFCKYAFVDRYDEGGETISWSSCSLRKTLNGAFYEQAFTLQQKECIMEVKTDQTWGSKKSNTDKVFLLGERDIEKNSFIMLNAILPYDNRPFWLRVPINDAFDGSGKNKGKAKYYDNRYRNCVSICDQRSVLVVRPAIRIPLK